MTPHSAYTLHPVGSIRSPLTSRRDAPMQAAEGAPEAWIEIDLRYAAALDGIAAGSELLVLTWLHLGERETLRVHPRGDRGSRARGVFATRSPDRPNPIGLHRVRVLEVVPPARLRVDALEAVDGTPVIDIKPVRDPAER